MLARTWRVLASMALLAGASALPAAAQGAWPALPPSRVAITPIVGYQFGLVQSGGARVELDTAEVGARFSSRSAGGALLGLRIAVPLETLVAAPQAVGIRLVGSFAAAEDQGGDATLLLDVNGSNDTVVVVTGRQSRTRIYQTSLGVGLRVPVGVPMELTIAPTLARVVPQERPRGALDRTRTVVYPGLGLGADVDLPTYVRGMFLHFGVEDALTFANRDLAERFDRFFVVEEDMRAARTNLPRRASHRITLRTGLSLRF